MANTDCCSIHLGDNTIFNASVYDCNDNIVSLSGAQLLSFTFKKPNGTNVSKTPGFIDNGIMRYVAESGFLDIKGLWQVQGRVIDSGTREFHTSIHKFKVEPNL